MNAKSSQRRRQPRSSSCPWPGGRAVTYTDNAGNYSGTTGYAGQNGGTGFGAFNVASVGGAGTFVYTATQSEAKQGTPPPSSIDTGGQSFGFYSGGTTDASITIARAFNTDETSAGIGEVGDSFALDFVSGYNDGGVNNNPGAIGTSGVSLLDGTTRVGTFQYNANNNYTFNGSVIQGQNFTPGALHLVYTITSPDTYSFASTGAVTYNGTGAFSDPITGFEVQQTNSGVGDPGHDGFFNSPTLTADASPAPEPSQVGVLALMGLGLGGLLLRARPSRAGAADILLKIIGGIQ